MTNDRPSIRALPANLEFDPERIGEALESPSVEIAATATRAFAEATNDPNDAFVNGHLAPPLYAIVPVLKTLVQAKSAVTADFAFHGEHDLAFFEHLRPGVILTPSATVVGVRQRSTGVAIAIRIKSYAEERKLLNEQYATLFASGARITESVGEDAPRRVPPPTDESKLLHEVTLRVDPDQTQRFAAASDDWDPYTLEEEAAQRMGFETIILHGPCTMAFAARAVVDTVCDGDAQNLRRLSMRLSHPVHLVPEQRLTVRIYAMSVAREDAYSFEVSDRDGRTVVKNGWADVNRGSTGETASS